MRLAIFGIAVTLLWARHLTSFDMKSLRAQQSSLQGHFSGLRANQYHTLISQPGTWLWLQTAHPERKMLFFWPLVLFFQYLIYCFPPGCLWWIYEQTKSKGCFSLSYLNIVAFKVGKWEITSLSLQSRCTLACNMTSPWKWRPAALSGYAQLITVRVQNKFQMFQVEKTWGWCVGREGEGCLWEPPTEGRALLVKICLSWGLDGGTGFQVEAPALLLAPQICLLDLAGRCSATGNWGIIPAAFKTGTYPCVTAPSSCSTWHSLCSEALMEAVEANGICFSLFITSNYSSIEFNYYLFFFFLPFEKCCSIEKGSHLSRLHLTLSGSKAGRSFKLLLSVKLTTKKSS